MSVTTYDAMNDALEQGAGLGFEMKPGFSTHWSMGSEALIALGHAELVHDWVTLFIARHKHYDLPGPVRPIDMSVETDWRAALGDFERVGDWLVAFKGVLAERPWRDVVVQWWPRLVFGCSAGLTHCLIRTMHAVRSLDRSGDDASDLQLGELAMALGYWAARYVEQPASKTPHGDRWFPEILASIPRLDPDSEIGLRDKGYFLHIPAIEGWGTAVSELAAPDGVQAAFSDLTLAFVQAQLAHPELFPIPQVHATTGPAAMRVMLDYLPEELHKPSFVAAYHAAAALMSSFLQPNPDELRLEPDLEHPVPSPDELIERAVEHGDMHAIKVTEACLREYAIRPDPRYLQLPQRIVDVLPAFFR